MSEVVRRPAADRDLVAGFRYYLREATEEVADRFFAEVEATFARLAVMPGLGTRYAPEEPLYAAVRYFPVSRFRSYLVSYRPLANGIEVYRVLHGARDIASILAEELGLEENAGNNELEE